MYKTNHNYFIDQNLVFYLFTELPVNMKISINFYLQQSPKLPNPNVNFVVLNCKEKIVNERQIS